MTWEDHSSGGVMHEVKRAHMNTAAPCGRASNYTVRWLTEEPQAASVGGIRWMTAV